ncbi:MAG: hypothetical protein Q4C04_04380 [Clostridia bacterium]|nr:hypothetical protein [Clostridia bacterium]
MKICAYVQDSYAKANYKNECMDIRQFTGLRVIIDCLERAGYTVDYAGRATVHLYDVVLVSLTSDCDWWSFVAERLRWQRGDYKVIIGGAGVLHISPFIRWGDYFMFGRGEDLIVPLVDAIVRGDEFEHESVANAATFSLDKVYYVAQARNPYPHKIRISEKRTYDEGTIGCPHKCFFCGYTWHRRFCSTVSNDYRMSESLFGGMEDKERAMLDLAKNKEGIDFKHLRTTAIDGMSERLRRMVNKPITKEIFQTFLSAMLAYAGKPHQLKLYNVIGYPTETFEDWMEFYEALVSADRASAPREKQWSIVLHSTPFRPMPATPMACCAMSKRNYRGEVGRTLGKDLKGNLIYQGKSLWAVESMGTDSLSTVMLSAIAHRGSLSDSENIAKLCASKKFWNASATVKEATLTRYFDMDKLFGEFTPADLPSRYLRTYAKVERLWGTR